MSKLAQEAPKIPGNPPESTGNENSDQSPSSDSDSSLSSDSSDSSSEDDDRNKERKPGHAHIIDGRPVSFPPKPEDEIPLRDRLKAFLPQMQQANDLLEPANPGDRGAFELKHEGSEGEDEGYSSEAEDGPYIEMNLGLGVLEQIKEGDGSIQIPGQDAADVAEGGKRSASDVGGEDERGVMDQLTGVGGGQSSKRRKTGNAGAAKVQVVDDAKDSGG